MAGVRCNSIPVLWLIWIWTVKITPVGVMLIASVFGLHFQTILFSHVIRSKTPRGFHYSLFQRIGQSYVFVGWSHLSSFVPVSRQQSGTNEFKPERSQWFSSVIYLMFQINMSISLHTITRYVMILHINILQISKRIMWYYGVHWIKQFLCVRTHFVEITNRIIFSIACKGKMLKFNSWFDWIDAIP